jgi:hypothetical protein
LNQLKAGAVLSYVVLGLSNIVAFLLAIHLEEKLIFDPNI